MISLYIYIACAEEVEGLIFPDILLSYLIQTRKVEFGIAIFKSAFIYGAL